MNATLFNLLFYSKINFIFLFNVVFLFNEQTHNFIFSWYLKCFRAYCIQFTMFSLNKILKINLFLFYFIHPCIRTNCFVENKNQKTVKFYFVCVCPKYYIFKTKLEWNILLIDFSRHQFCFQQIIFIKFNRTIVSMIICRKNYWQYPECLDHILFWFLV